jgi:hypothetical protein
MHYCARGMDLVNRVPATLDVKELALLPFLTSYVTNIQHVELSRR